MIDAAIKLVEICKQKKIKIAVAESCTGGLVASAITAVSGSSAVFDRGFVTYSNDSKIDLLDVSKDSIERHGAVSAEIAEQMVIGAKAKSVADIAVSITGIAGPTGSTETKPVGLVFIALRYRGETEVIENYFSGNRQEIREQASIKAMNMMYSKLLS